MDVLLPLNRELRAAGIRLTIVVRSHKLSLRGMFPTLEGNGVAQQYLALGLDNTARNRARAKAIAMKVWSELELGQFDWRNYRKKVVNTEVCGYWLDKFKSHYLRHPNRSEATWRRDCELYFRRLDRDRRLTEEYLIQIAQQTPPASRTRERLVRLYVRFAKFAGIPYDTLQSYAQGYSAPQKERALPSDEQIYEIYATIKNPKWRRVYALMAIYGLRDHECWFCDVENTMPYKCWVRAGKTGARGPILPLPIAWAEEWQPWEGELPTINLRPDKDTHKIYGERTAQYFRRQNLPFSPYTLRHCYAVRGIKVGLHPTIAARMMGHAVTVHQSIYHKWISDREIMQEWERITN